MGEGMFPVCSARTWGLLTQWECCGCWAQGEAGHVTPPALATVPAAWPPLAVEAATWCQAARVAVGPSVGLGGIVPCGGSQNP